jgi:tetratricopeptide (TPR) repeat protein
MVKSPRVLRVALIVVAALIAGMMPMRLMRLVIAICVMASLPAAAEVADDWRNLGPFGNLNAASFPMCLRMRPPQDAAACLPPLPPSTATPDEQAFAHVGRAIIYFRAMDSDNSRFEIDAALTALPNSVQLLHTKARFDMIEGFWRAKRHLFISAMTAIEHAIRLQPDNLNLKMSKAVLLDYEFRREFALKITMEVLNLDPTFTAAWLFAGRLNSVLNDPNAAIEAYEHALALDAQVFGGDGALGQLYLQTGNADRAIQHFTRSINRHKNDRDSYIGRAAAYTLLGDAPAALENFTKAIDGPEPGFTFASSEQDLARLWLGGLLSITSSSRASEPSPT